MNNNAPRLVFAAPKSGSGKTMTVCGIIEALKKRKLNIAVFKCGPDYIDPMFHRKALGVETGNLDTFLPMRTPQGIFLLTGLKGLILHLLKV